MDPPGGAWDHDANLHLAPAVPGGRLRLGTMNCRTLKAPWHRITLVQLAHDLQLDLIMQQEISIVAEPGLHSEDLGSDCGRGGVGVLIGPRLWLSVHCASLSPRLMRVDLCLRARCIRLFCAYVPTAAHPEEARAFVDFLAGQLEEFRGGSSARPMSQDARTPISMRWRICLTGWTWCPCPCPCPCVLVSVSVVSGHICGLKEKATERTRPERHEETGATRSCADSHSRAPPRHQLRHHGSTGSPLYRPPKQRPRCYYRALSDTRVKRHFAGAFIGALGDQSEAEYSDISTAIRAAVEQTVPLLRPAQKSLPSDPTIRQARLNIERLRRNRWPTGDAEDAFERLPDERLQAAVDGAV
uniref:Endo/exonuclease/phosphatase domain-containing protein n=1 Tax=Macrostomum lignano TaxID=282301 RepID=A0A1I8I136_9PLAT